MKAAEMVSGKLVASKTRLKKILSAIGLSYSDTDDYDQKTVDLVDSVNKIMAERSIDAAEALAIHRMGPAEPTSGGSESEPDLFDQRVDEIRDYSAQGVDVVALATKRGEANGAKILILSNIVAAQVVATGEVSDPDLADQVDRSGDLLEAVCTGGLKLNLGKMIPALDALTGQTTFGLRPQLEQSTEALSSTA